MTTEEFLQWMGGQVKALRKKSGLTQADIAVKTGSNQSTISLFENQGKGIESVDIIRRIVEATGHTMGDLFDPSEKKNDFYRIISEPVPLVSESTPDHDLYDAFRRALRVFLRAYNDGVAENIREEERLEQELHQAAVQYQAATTQQTEPQPAI